MEPSFLQILICLLLSIAVIVVLTARFRVHAFFALFIACFIVGLGVQIPMSNLITIIKDGFGNIMKSLGLVIILGTTLGVLLEQTGSTNVMASYILKKTGERRSALAMSITGFIIGMPLFCDSGYIVLSGLNKSLAKRTGISLAIMSGSLATGLYSVHCLIPPHPGASTAAGLLGVDFGKLILTGIIIALPAAIAGYVWSRYGGKNSSGITEEEHVIVKKNIQEPTVVKAFLPVIVPILLIASRSFFDISAGAEQSGLAKLLILGDPVIALSIGVMLAFNCMRPWKKASVSFLLHEGVEKAGSILVIIGGGGAFGAVLAATKIGEHFSQVLPLGTLGILFPFLLTFILKTAQGSSTVAIITAASIVLPLLPALGLDNENGRMFSVLSMGAGSMMISHANDAYFWVIAKFSGLDMKTMLRVYSIATIIMGLSSLLIIYLIRPLF